VTQPACADTSGLFRTSKDTIMKKSPTLSAAVAGSLAALLSAATPCVYAVEPDGTNAALVVKDSSITSSIKAQLSADAFKGLSHIDVDTDDHGIVTLKGKVPSQDAADRAISIARATAGVRTVKSALKVKIDD
jgi:hyperosmotically inducible protein